MKKVFFTLLSLLVFSSGAWAGTPTISFRTVEVKQENTGYLYFTLNSDGEQVRDFQVEVTLPVGFEYVLGTGVPGAGILRDVSDSEVVEPSETSGGTYRFVFMSGGGIVLPDGDVMAIPIKEVGGYEIGETFQGTAHDLILSCNDFDDSGNPNGVKDYKVASIPFTIEIIEDVIHLYDDVTTTEQIVDYEGNVRIHRALKANQWNTIVLPFAMDEEMMTAAFGPNVKVAEFMGTELSDDGMSLDMKFNSIKPAAMQAHHPYIINTGDADDIDAETGFRVNNVTMAPLEEGKELIVQADPDVFYGTYRVTDIESTRTGRPGRYTYTLYAYLSGNKFYYLSVGNTTTIKAFRGYFMVDYLLDILGYANVNFFVDDDQVTGINDVTTSAPVAEGVYDLQGRKVSDDLNTLKSGVYIINGKKVVVK